jgi:hypothetical protein
MRPRLKAKNGWTEADTCQRGSADYRIHEFHALPHSSDEQGLFLAGLPADTHSPASRKTNSRRGDASLIHCLKFLYRDVLLCDHRDIPLPL